MSKENNTVLDVYKYCLMQRDRHAKISNNNRDEDTQELHDNYASIYDDIADKLANTKEIDFPAL